MTGRGLEPRQQSNARLLKTKTWYQSKPQPDSALLGCFAELLLSRSGFRENLLVQNGLALLMSMLADCRETKRCHDGGSDSLVKLEIASSASHAEILESDIHSRPLDALLFHCKHD